MNPKANRYGASPPNFKYIFLSLLFSKIEHRKSGRFNIVGHGVGSLRLLYIYTYIYIQICFVCHIYRKYE